MSIESNTPSAEASATLAALKRAVEKTLDRKRRLGQYAVVWQDGKAALLDDDVEDRDAFFEALHETAANEAVASKTHSQDSQSGIADSEGDYQSNGERD